MPTAEQLTAPDANHGEGPVWSAGWRGLRWVDMHAGDVLHLEDETGVVDRWHVGSVAAALRPRSGGGAVIATERNFVLADRVGGEVRSVATAFTDPGIRFNDGACDPAGNFLCGTMAYDEGTGRGTLYRLNVDETVDTVFDGVTISNGLAWTADAGRAFYVDTPTGQIDVFDSDATGRLTDRRPFAVIEESAGFPDGLTVDAEGGIWVALYDGRAVRHYDSSGQLADVIDIAAQNVTACTFGGPDLTELFITTSRQGGDDEHPGAGAVFRYATGVAGLPVQEFGG